MTAESETPADLRSNVELKARIADLEAVRRIACELATDRLPDQHQVDTYFRCQTGRLKLREINGRRAELIWYQRPDQTAAKTSQYGILEIDDARAVKRVLTAALGTWAVVDKHREIFLVDNVRIHLDQVDGLGTFLEFEAVLGASVDAHQGLQQVESLQQQFGIGPNDLIDTSYADLMPR